MAGGDLTHRAQPQGDDELADLMRALNRMCVELGQSMGEVFRVADSIRTACRRSPPAIRTSTPALSKRPPAW